MNIAHEQLKGLDRDRVLAAVEPVLRAHGVEGVELCWRTDAGGRVLELTLERPDSKVPGAGITIDLCSEISRDLSAALDVADAIPQSYRLQVGSPGLERALYSAADYARFAGQNARLKLRQVVDGQRVLHGTLHGLDDEGRVVIETDRGELGLEIDVIDSGRLQFDWKRGGASAGKPRARRQSAGSGQKAHKPERSR
jgi:ribosome maturation factor RimP